jgi:hypothetical protein
VVECLAVECLAVECLAVECLAVECPVVECPVAVSLESSLAAHLVAPKANRAVATDSL